ncbi:leucine-rich_repeat domain-containing protein [Hexamita inflata]|uniref:Leucine-rich repeat domain-containing protein n=1 Tax=Hexamita inflata TaxID=28002 RepID=A0AA86NHX3_9EUKA|nr:leucine-rich repeat domain-containing protein [Hexamita inflata]
MSNNNIKDISPVQKLQKLIILYANDNKIVNVDALRHQVNVQRLDVSNNSVVYAYPLQSLSSLQQIILERNKIADFDSIQNLQCFTEKYKNQYFRDDRLYSNRKKQNELGDQSQPLAQELAFANKLRDVDKSNILLQKVNKNKRNLSKNITKFQQNIQQTLQRETYKQINFTQNVINLFGVLRSETDNDRQHHEYDRQPIQDQIIIQQSDLNKECLVDDFTQQFVNIHIEPRQSLNPDVIKNTEDEIISIDDDDENVNSIINVDESVDDVSEGLKRLHEIYKSTSRVGKNQILNFAESFEKLNTLNKFKELK